MTPSPALRVAAEARCRPGGIDELGAGVGERLVELSCWTADDAGDLQDLADLVGRARWRPRRRRPRR